MNEIPDTIINSAIRNSSIVAKVLAALPCNNFLEHTPESIPDRVANLVSENAQYHNALEIIADGTAYSKDVAQRALGWTDNEHFHIELLREENLKLKLELEKYKIESTLNTINHEKKDQKSYGKESASALQAFN